MAIKKYAKSVAQTATRSTNVIFTRRASIPLRIPMCIGYGAMLAGGRCVKLVGQTRTLLYSAAFDVVV
jgi:hypothetical protein